MIAECRKTQKQPVNYAEEAEALEEIQKSRLQG